MGLSDFMGKAREWMTPERGMAMQAIGQGLSQMSTGQPVNLSPAYQALQQRQKAAQMQRVLQGSGVLERFTPEQRAILAQMEPGAAQRVIAESLFAPEPEPKRYNVGGALVDAGGNVIYQPDPASMMDDPSVQSSEILHDGTVVTVMKDGSTRVLAPTGQELQGEGRAQAIQTARSQRAESERAVYGARREGTLGADIEMGGTAAATEALGKEQGTFVTSAFEQADQAASSIRNIQTAIDAIDAGAKSGAMDRYLPNVTEASASLQNAMDKMGLDVIGSVTFGALSEGEMRLAMETAVPRNLDEPQLRSWLSKKLDAQRKLRVALMEQARFLSDPQNTLNDWAEMVGQRAEQESPAAQPVTTSAQPGGNLESQIQSIPDFGAMTDEQLQKWIEENG